MTKDRPRPLPAQLRALPAPVGRSHPRYDELSRRVDMHQAIVACCGVDLPPCILDDALLDDIYALVSKYGPQLAGEKARATAPMWIRALVRQVARNVARLKLEGVDLWAL